MTNVHGEKPHHLSVDDLRALALRRVNGHLTRAIAALGGAARRSAIAAAIAELRRADRWQKIADAYLTSREA